MSGQTRSNKAKFSNSKLSCKNMPIVSSFASGFQKNVCFHVRQFEMLQSAFQKVTSHLHVFYHSTAKYKDTILKFGMGVVCV